MNFDKQINSILGKKLNYPNLLAKKTKGDWDGDGVTNKKDCQPRNPIRQDKIVSKKQYGEHILIQDSKGKKYSTKNIEPIGCRTMFDGDYIHGKNKKPDIILKYEL